MSKLPHVKTDTFEDEVLQSKLPVVVDFYATWCGPCRIIGPILEELAGEFDGKVKVVKVDIDEDGPLASQFQITGVPTLLTFKDGKVADQLVGLAPAGVLRQRFEQAAASQVA